MGPTELAMLEAQHRVNAGIHDPDLEPILALLLANQTILARALDALGASLLAGTWPTKTFLP